MFPVVYGVPILLNEAQSVFTIANVIDQGRRRRKIQGGRIRSVAKRILPELAFNLKSKRNYDKFAQLLLAETSHSLVLVVGGQTLGKGMDGLMRPEFRLIETDVSLAGRTRVVCDGHDLPFADCSVDAVVVQAVLEHVLDPYRCVEEIHRVLKPTGLVYAETPFMQQVHGGRFDFTRFTPLGHRRLFRHFEQLASGSGGGPGVVLAWSYHYFLRAFARTPRGQRIATVFARVTGFWLKYFDYWLIDRPAAQDGTWGYFFLGRKSAYVLPDRDLLTQYPGLDEGLVI